MNLFRLSVKDFDLKNPRYNIISPIHGVRKDVGNFNQSKCLHLTLCVDVSISIY